MGLAMWRREVGREEREGYCSFGSTERVLPNRWPPEFWTGPTKPFGPDTKE
jgi:hypothetical protein